MLDCSSQHQDVSVRGKSRLLGERKGVARTLKRN